MMALSTAVVSFDLLFLKIFLRRADQARRSAHRTGLTQRQNRRAIEGCGLDSSK
jgi:hypothetical protein